MLGKNLSDVGNNFRSTNKTEGKQIKKADKINQAADFKVNISTV